MKLQAARTVLRGDANGDMARDVTDAMNVLNYLFLGGESPICPAAADFDLSGELDISDAVSFLGSVYLGEPPLDSLAPSEVPCR